MPTFILLLILSAQSTTKVADVSMMGDLLFMDDGKEIGRCVPAKDNTFDHPSYSSCTFDDKARIVTLILRHMRDQENSYNKCGDFGPWILDQHSNIMGRYRNPPCPEK